MCPRCLITAGPTREFLDPVRYITNPSSGKMGYALAQAALEAGWTVDLVSGPVSLAEPEGVILYPVVTAQEMFRQVDALFDACDILLMTAAVCDMRPKQTTDRKVKKDALSMTVEFEPTIDILRTVAARRKPNQCVVGFAAETHDVVAYATRKLHEKNLSFIAANQVGGPNSAFESESNTLTLISREHPAFTIGPANKRVVAHELIATLRALVPQLRLHTE